jgi:hypothetical protein
LTKLLIGLNLQIQKNNQLYRELKIKIDSTIDIAKEYLRVESILQPAIDLNNGLYESKDILESLIKHEYQLFTAKHSAIVTTINPYPRGTVLHLFLAGGNLEELEELYKETEEFARYQNCKSITLLGRFGWKKSFLTEYGMKPTCLQMSKEL